MLPDEAKKQYRSAWASYCLSRDPRQKEILEQIMDGLQPRICHGPGPEWQTFVKTLPGFLDFWSRWLSESLGENDDEA